MAYNSAHTGPQIDAAVEMLGQIQSARDATAADRDEVAFLASQVDGNASQVASQAATVSAQTAQVLASAAEVDQAHDETLSASALAVDAKDAAALSALSAQASKESSTASASAAAQSQVEAGLSEQISAENAESSSADRLVVETLAEQVEANSESAQINADSAALSALNAAAVVTGGTATIAPAPGKIPLADAVGKINSDWLGADVARSQAIADIQDPIDPAKGGALVGFLRTPLAEGVTSVGQMLSAQAVNIWEFAKLVVSRPTSDPATWDWTPAFQAAADSPVVAIAVPDQLYILRSVAMTKNKAWLCTPGVTFQRKAGMDVAGSSWVPGVGMFEDNVHGLDIAFVGGMTFDGNNANQPAIEPNGFAVKIHPPTMTSTLDTRLYMDRPKFKNGTSGYLMLRGADFNRKFRTVVILKDPVFTDSKTGKGAGDPSTPTALGYSPTYVTNMDYVELISENTEMSFSRPTVVGEYAPTGILGTFFGSSFATSGECLVTLTGKTRVQGLGRKSQTYDGSGHANNGIGAIDVYGNGESLVIEDLYGKACEAYVARAKASIRRYVINNSHIEDSYGAINVSTSSTGNPQAVIEIGNVDIINCGVPCIFITGNSTSLLVPSLHIGRARVVNGVDNGNVPAGANGAVHIRYIDHIQLGPVEVDGAVYRGITVMDNVDFIAEDLNVKNTGGEGVKVDTTVNSNVIGRIKTKNTKVAGISFTGVPKLTVIDGGDCDDGVDYGVFANLSAGAGRCNLQNVNTSNITGLSRGLYFANVNARVERCSAGAGVTTPLLKVASARVAEFGNSWNPATFYGTAFPTDGTYVRGDLVYNTAPVAGGNVGWECVTAGSPGTWKSFGTISA